VREAGLRDLAPAGHLRAEWPLGLFALIVGVILLVGRIGWWIVWKDSD
jgi:hypothetical protein